MYKQIIILIVLLITSCATERPKGKTEAEILFKEANELMVDGQYTLANQKLNQIKSQHPYSFYAAKAELLSADIYYKQDNYIESASAYLIFKDMHPSYKNLDYVYLRIADSFFMQRPSTYDRDLNACHRAIKYYDQFLLKFSNSSRVINAKKNKNVCFEMIKDKEKYIADFYYKTKVYDAAIFRYLNILKQFNDSKIKQHAMVRIILSYSKLKKKKECLSFKKKFKGRLNSESLEKLNQGCI